MSRIQLKFESEVNASPERAWEWITSLKGISAEMTPYFRMTAPEGIESMADLAVTPGKALFRSKIYLFGFLPIGYSDITLLELKEGEGFIEQSPMKSMKLWRHERRITATSNGCRITDRLTFEPERASGFVAWYIRTVFNHRHKVIRRKLNTTG